MEKKKSFEVLLGLLREAKYFQLDGLVTAIKPLLREVDVITQHDAEINFKPSIKSLQYQTDPQPGYLGKLFCITSMSWHAVVYECKNMKKLLFHSIRFDHPVSFISCDLTSASFRECSFGSSVTFKDCILDNTEFTKIGGIVANVNFTGSKIDKINFSTSLRLALEAGGKV